MRQLTTTERLIKQTLAAKPFFRPEAGPALVRILNEYCTSDDHRRRVCERAMTMRFGPEDNPEDRAPGPAELAELCSKVCATPLGEATPDCVHCHGDGWEDTGRGFRRCRCGGRPMSSESRLAWSRKERREREFEEGASGERAGERVCSIR